MSNRNNVLTQKNLKIGLISVFAALHSVLYFLSFGSWRNWAIYLEPVEGIILGPQVGFFAALFGSVIGRFIKPTPDWMFGVIAEPLGVLAAGFLAKGKWKETTIIYGFMLSAYFIHPYGRMLPFWTILDLLIAFALIYPASKISKEIWRNRTKRFPLALLLVAFVSTVVDSMTRVFLLIPAGFYQVFNLSYEVLAYEWFIPGAIGSYIEDVLVSIVTLVACVPLLMSLKKILGLNQPLS